MRLYYLGLVISFLFSTLPVYAAININEIAWMGSIESANHEWIELRNLSADAISVDGWTISDGLNLNIPLQGMIGPNSLVVLERSSDDSSPHTAFLIYTGALVNSGVTLVLRDQAGQIIDQVVGGENWANIGGNNTTKETAQLTNRGWITSTPTPGMENNSGTNTTTNNTNTNTSQNTAVVSSSNKSSSAKISSPKGSETINLNQSIVDLDVKLRIQTVAYVNQKVKFEANTVGFADKSPKLVSYEWNFGDSYTGFGKRVEHSYSYPGSYVVTVEAAYKDKRKVVRHEITVLPVNLSISFNLDGDILVHNNALYDVDISDYLLRGESSLTFPPYSIILPRSTITIAASRLQVTQDNLVALYDAKKNLVASTYQELFFPSATELSTESYPPVGSVLETTKPTAIQPVVPFNFFSQSSTSQEEVLKESPKNNPTTAMEVDFPEEQKPPETRWPYLVFIGMLLAVLFGIFNTKSSR